MYKDNIFLFILGFVLFAIIAPRSLAQPGAFTLTVVTSDTGNGFKLSWVAPQSPVLMQGETVEHYLVRREPNNGVDPPDSISFVPLDTLRNIFEYVDYPPLSIPGGYIYMVRAKTTNARYLPSNLVYVPFVEVTAVESKYSQYFPTKYELNQNFPNPFNPTTIINYQLSVSGFVKLRVLDVLGREVTTLVNEEKHAGSYTATWESKNMSSGVYFYQLIIKGTTLTKKMLLVR